MISAAGGAALLGLLLLLGRKWLTATVEHAVRSSFEQDLERVRADLRMSEERLKSSLRDREAEIDSVRSNVLSGRSELVGILHKRRLVAVEKIWSATVQLSRIQMPAMMLSVLKVENVSKQISRNVELQKFFGAIVPDEMLKSVGNIRAEEERPFVSELAWALFSAYNAIVVTGLTHIKILSIGIEDSEKLIEDSKIKDLVKAVLPHQANWLDTHGPSAAYHLLEEIRNKLLQQLRTDVDSPELDKEHALRSASIMQHVNQISADVAAARISPSVLAAKD